MWLKSLIWELDIVWFNTSDSGPRTISTGVVQVHSPACWWDGNSSLCRMHERSLKINLTITRPWLQLTHWNLFLKLYLFTFVFLYSQHWLYPLFHPAGSSRRTWCTRNSRRGRTGWSAWTHGTSWATWTSRASRTKLSCWICKLSTVK